MFFVEFRLLSNMSSMVDGIVEVPLTDFADNAGGNGHQESIKLLDATAPNLAPDLIGQVSSGYPSCVRLIPARAVESAMRIVGAAIHVPSNVGGISEIAVTNRTGSTALTLIDKQVHSLRTLGAVFDDRDNGVDKFIAWHLHGGGGVGDVRKQGKSGASAVVI